MRFKMEGHVLSEDFVTIQGFVFEKVSRESIDGMDSENAYKSALLSPLNGYGGYAADPSMMHRNRGVSAFEDAAWQHCVGLKGTLEGTVMVITRYWDKGYDVGFMIEHDGYRAQIDIQVREDTKSVRQRIIW